MGVLDEYISHADIPVGPICNRSCRPQEALDEIVKIAYNDDTTVSDIIYILRSHGYER